MRCGTGMKKTKTWVFAACFCAVFYGLTFQQADAAALKHLIPTEDAYDCYGCHKKATPRIAQDWHDSKHGMLLMKCFVCHGQPGGEGSISWAVNPDPKAVCMKCHEPAMKRMEAKFGINPDCNRCHPFHQNSLHHDAYRKSESRKQ